MKNKNIVITGISGCIGQVLYKNLKDRWEISGIDIKEPPGTAVRIADISDIDSIGDAFRGAYAVIHLAANAWGGASWDEIIGPNITGTYNVFQAAQQAGVGKIIFVLTPITLIPATVLSSVRSYIWVGLSAC